MTQRNDPTFDSPDGSGLKEAVEAHVRSRSAVGRGGATAATLAQALGCSVRHARRLLRDLPPSWRTAPNSNAAPDDDPVARWIWATPRQLSDERAAKSRRDFVDWTRTRSGHPTRAQLYEALVDDLEASLNDGNMAHAQEIVRRMGPRWKDHVRGTARADLALRMGVADVNRHMQAGNSQAACTVAAQFARRPGLPPLSRAELLASLGAAQRMAPETLRLSVETYDSALAVALSLPQPLQTQRVRHILTARSAPLAALGRADAALDDLGRAASLARDAAEFYETQLCRVRALSVLGREDEAGGLWPGGPPGDLPLWLRRWVGRFGWSFLPPEASGVEAWNRTGAQLWRDNRGHGFQRRLIEARIARDGRASSELLPLGLWRVVLQLRDQPSTIQFLST